MEIINLNGICGGCASAKLGTKLDTLEKDLADGKTYSGDLLTDEEVAALNNICPVLSKLSLGTYINGILAASKNGTEAPELTEEQINILNNQTCGGFTAIQVGSKIEEFAEIINDQPTPPTPSTEANILTYKIGEAIGTVNAETGAIAVEVPYGTTVTALVAEFTLSENATAKVGSVAQVSGTTENDFTNPVVYVVTAEDGTTTKNWTVTVTVAPGKVTLTYDLNGGRKNGQTKITEEYDEGTTVDLTQFDSTGMTFPIGYDSLDGFTTVKDDAATKVTSIKVDADTTVYALYVPHQS